MDAKLLVEKYKDQMIEDLIGLLKINSVKGESTNEAPLGQGPKEALSYMLELGQKENLTTKNIENLAGHIEFGQGDKIFGILGHVDVVPAGNGWTSDPFEPIIKNGNIYARGVQDDKGPTMAAFYALKILENEGYHFNQRVRLIIGTDEESDWTCTKAYFKSEEMPHAGFSPDAEFPVIHGEKGMTTFNLVQTKIDNEFIDGDIQLKAFVSGERYNMVPDTAEAKLNVLTNMSAVIQSFEGFIRETGHKGSYEIDRGFLNLQLNGQSAHGSTPEEGVNAGLELLKFLTLLELDPSGRKFVNFAADYIIDNFKGDQFKMNYSHEEMGEVSVNTGIINYTEVDGENSESTYVIQLALILTVGLSNIKKRSRMKVLQSKILQIKTLTMLIKMIHSFKRCLKVIEVMLMMIEKPLLLVEGLMPEPLKEASPLAQCLKIRKILCIKETNIWQ